MLLAVAPTWFADHVTQILVLALLVLSVVVLLMVQQATLRLTLLAVIAAIALLVYVNRTPLEACARTCECRIADRDITIPGCDPGTH